MKKRLRKKFGMGEFYTPWFGVTAELQKLGDGDQAALVEKFIKTAESFGLVCEGSITPEELVVYIDTGVVGSENAERREQFIAAVQSWPEFSKFEATELE